MLLWHRRPAAYSVIFIKALPSDLGSDLSPLLSLAEMHLEMVSLVLSYTVQERCGHTGVSPAQQHKDDLWNGLFDIREAAQPGKGEAYRNLTNVRNI